MSDMEKFNERLNSDIYEDEECMATQGVGRGGVWGDRGGWRGGRGGGGLPRGAGETVFLFGPGVNQWKRQKGLFSINLYIPRWRWLGRRRRRSVEGRWRRLERGSSITSGERGMGNAWTIL